MFLCCSTDEAGPSFLKLQPLTDDSKAHTKIADSLAPHTLFTCDFIKKVKFNLPLPFSAPVFWVTRENWLITFVTFREMLLLDWKVNHVDNWPQHSSSIHRWEFENWLFHNFLNVLFWVKSLMLYFASAPLTTAIVAAQALLCKVCT